MFPHDYPPTPEPHIDLVRASERPARAWTFTGRWLRHARRPLVYSWTRRRQPLYVGVGTKGLARILGEHHRLTRDAVKDGDRIGVYLCQNAGHAINLEQQLIEEFRPTLNGAAGPAIDRNDPSAYRGLQSKIEALKKENDRLRAILADIALLRAPDPVATARAEIGWSHLTDNGFLLALERFGSR